MNIDYSKNDFIDINNKLFRLARNKISENSKGIKDLDDDNKSKGENNLVVYGSELINNLNQINYTFKQLEDYIFVPITKGKTKKDIEKIIEKGPTTPISELKEVAPLLSAAFDEFEAIGDEDELPALETPEILPFQDYTFISFSDLSTYTLTELEDQIRYLANEIEKIVNYIYTDLNGEGITIPEKGLDDGDFVDSLIGDPKIPSGIKSLVKYLIDLNLEGNTIQKLIKAYPKKELVLEPEKEPVLEPVLEAEPEKGEPVLSKITKGVKFPTEKVDLTDLKDILNSPKVEDRKTYLHDELKRLGFSGPVSKLTIPKIKILIDVYESKTTGAGRRLKGGAGKKGMKKGVRINKTDKTPTTPTTPLPSTPVINDDEEDYEDETDPIDELKKNKEIAKKLDKTLKNAANTSQTSPIPGYITKIYELMTNLVQFIGRTNVLYISRIKKNLNYLDEEQVKLIYAAIFKFKDNLQILKNFKNKGSALIKETLYNQVEKETLNLYNEIYNSIRNYSKMKDYTIMAGSGMSNYYMDPMLGGYFIQSDSPFITHSTTKRFF